MGKVMKEANTRRTRIISNKRKWYQFHAGTQGDLDGATKWHCNCLKVILKTQTISYFPSSTEIHDKHRLNGIWYRWIWTNHIWLARDITGCTGVGGTSDTMRIAPSVLYWSVILGRRLEKCSKTVHLEIWGQ